jgi:hypothetical protein
MRGEVRLGDLGIAHVGTVRTISRASRTIDEHRRGSDL